MEQHSSRNPLIINPGSDSFELAQALHKRKDGRYYQSSIRLVKTYSFCLQKRSKMPRATCLASITSTRVNVRCDHHQHIDRKKKEKTKHPAILTRLTQPPSRPTPTRGTTCDRTRAQDRLRRPLSRTSRHPPQSREPPPHPKNQHHLRGLRGRA